MKNSLHLRKNNKGAALVSIMIAIAFMSIIASTLLLISFNNYRMKVINNISKANFYEVEQDINVITAKVRTMVDTTNSDQIEAKIKEELGGSNTATTYTAEKIKNLVYPSLSLQSDSEGKYVMVANALPDLSGTTTYDKFYFKDGAANSIEVITRTGGDEYVIHDIEVKQVNSQGFENTIKTDIHFYAQKSTVSSTAGGVGECSFLLDNGVEVDAINPYDSSSSTGTHVNIYGNCILGNYELITENFTTTTLSPNKSGTKHSRGIRLPITEDSINLTDKNKAIIYLHDCALLNILSDNSIIIGDIFLDGKSVLNVCNDNAYFTVVGNIYVSTNAAFICSGNLKLQDGCGIYKVDGSGNLTEVSGSDPSKNIIIRNSVTTLETAEYEGLYDKLKLFDDNADNDGVMPNILVKNTKKYSNKTGGSPSTISGFYCYEVNEHSKDDSKITKTYMYGREIKTVVPEGDLNGGSEYTNSLMLVRDNPYQDTVISQTNAGSTCIAKEPVKVTQTHNVCISQLGDQEFKKLRTGDYRIKMKNKDNVEGWFRVGDFFDPSCDNFVQDVFGVVNGGDSGPSTPSKTAVSFKNWHKL